MKKAVFLLWCSCLIHSSSFAQMNRDEIQAFMTQAFSKEYPLRNEISKDTEWMSQINDSTFLGYYFMDFCQKEQLLGYLKELNIEKHKSFLSNTKYKKWKQLNISKELINSPGNHDVYVIASLPLIMGDLALQRIQNVDHPYVEQDALYFYKKVNGKWELVCISYISLVFGD